MITNETALIVGANLLLPPCRNLRGVSEIHHFGFLDSLKQEPKFNRWPADRP